MANATMPGKTASPDRRVPANGVSSVDIDEASTTTTPADSPNNKKKISRQYHGDSFSDAVARLYSEQPDVFGALLPFRVRDLRKWMMCFCALDFNVDIGPEFECIYPPVNFSEQDLKTICFSSFPEQSYPDSADAFHTFRFKPTSPDIHLHSFASSAVHPQSTPFADELYLYGYVLFQQRKDTSRARHYSQKSLALISPFEFPAVFEVAVRKAAKYCFGPALVQTLQTATYQVSCWPDPVAVVAKYNAGFTGKNGKRKSLELPYLGDKIKVLVSSDPLLPVAEFVDHDSDVYLFGKIGSWGVLAKQLRDVADLFTIYELILLGQSVAVLANTPAMCSRFVANVADLIKPIPYTGLVRDYVTMHSDIESLNIMSVHPVPGVIGFTNPFLAQMIQECSGDISLIDISKPHKIMKRSPSLNISVLPILPDMMPVSATPQAMTLDLLYPVTTTLDWQRRSIQNLFQNVGIGKSSSSLSRKPRYLATDKQFVKTLRQMFADNVGCEKIDRYIRLYFANLTAKILAPIKRYLYVSQTSPKQFLYAEFMYYLRQATTSSSSTSGRLSLDRDGRSLPSLFGSMTLLSPLYAATSEHPEPAATPSLSESDSSSDISSPVPSPLSMSSSSSVTSSTASSTPLDQISVDLYKQAVMPDKGVFVDLDRATESYGVFLRSANFEAWCFM
ncbi:hypothetical protein V1525DRAFT_356724 [Lipomyces kononenkoae]|uniref:Uncharacterized protein n=1 Tax=Lipomyces kononenkoae TaxID=34357 RepID=A0ACC3T8Q3_LIPKO